MLYYTKEVAMPYLFNEGVTTTTTATGWTGYDQRGTGYTTSTLTAEFMGLVQAMEVLRQMAIEAAEAKDALERTACLQAVPTLQLLEQRRWERTLGHRHYLQQVAKAHQHAQLKHKPKFRKVNRRKLRS